MARRAVTEAPPGHTTCGVTMPDRTVLPTIFAMLVNPSVWSEAAVSAYFVLATVAACFYLFVKRVALLLFALPAIACFLVFSLSFLLS